MNIICTVSESNPTAIIAWSYASSIKPEQSDVITPGDFNGNSTKSTLSWKVSKQDNGAVFTCTAKHSLLNGGEINKTILLNDVLCKYIVFHKIHIPCADICNF